ncbi:MAG: hypothetical protein F2796_06475, partial [Actinobacteria bacterium]|nr:hypothetical protein [Actinomycetota bacterium]
MTGHHPPPWRDSIPRALRAPVRSSIGRAFTAAGFFGLVALAAAPSAFAGIVAPDAGSGSPNATGIRSLYIIIFVLVCVAFFGVGGLLLYTLRRFSAKRHPVAEQIDGNNRLEIGWAIGAAALMVVIAVVTLTQLNRIDNPPNSGALIAHAREQHEIDNPPNSGADGVPVTRQGSFMPPNGKSLQIQVNGQQYLWRYVYSDGDKDLLNNVYA